MFIEGRATRPIRKAENPMPELPEQKADCYSDNERDAMVWTQQLRARWCGPLLDILVRCHVRADHLTLLSLATGLSFSGLFFWSRGWAFGALVLHVVLDGLDGPLARRYGTDSRAGSFTDSTSDQIIVASTTITLMLTKPALIDPLAGGVYIFSYTMVMAYAMVRNAMGVPYSWVVRPRFFVYGWIVVEVYWWPHSINYVLWLFNILLLWKMATGFHRIRSTLTP